MKPGKTGVPVPAEVSRAKKKSTVLVATHGGWIFNIDQPIQIKRHFQFNHYVLCQNPSDVLQFHQDDAFRLERVSGSVDEDGSFDFGMRAGGSSRRGLRNPHLCSGEAVALVVAMIACHVRGVRLRDFDDVADGVVWF